MEILKKP